MWILNELGIPADRFDSIRLDLAATWPAWFVWLCMAACVIALVWTWRTVRPMRRRAVKVAILLLRLVTLACALTILLEPQVQLQKSARIRNRVAVVVDASESMSVKDQAGHAGRAEAVAEFFRRNHAYFQQLNDQFDVAYFTCGQNLAPVDFATLIAAPPANQSITDLCGALRALAERYRGSPLQAVLLFSDGGDNASSAPRTQKEQTFAQVLDHLQAPLFVLAPAIPKDFCDVAVSSVEYEDFTFVRSTWTAYATIKAIGFKGKPMPVSLMQGQHVIATQTLTPDDDLFTRRITFKFMPHETGKAVLTVSAPVFSEEALDINNTYRVLVRVIRDKIRVLHLCGRPSWDERFLRQTLKQDPNVDLVSLFILRTPSDYRAVPSSELSLIPFPENALYMENLREFDVAIFQNFNYQPYGLSRHLPNIRRFVREFGGGIVMIGGDFSFSEGLYANSPIADILPVELPVEREQTDTGAFRPQLTEAGRFHPITALDPDPAVNEKTWAALPALAGCNKVLGLRPGALALATHPTLMAGSDPMPVIAVAEPGRGRSLAVTTDSTWNWGLPALAKKGTTRPYFTFWHNALRWLIKDPELNPVRISTDRESYEPGEKVRVTISVLDRAYKPSPRAPVRFKLTGRASPIPSADREVFTNDVGYCETSFTPSAPGVYTFEATAQAKEGNVHTASETILVQRAGPELRDITINRELLTWLAQRSGGGYLELPAKAFPSGVTIPDPYHAQVQEKEAIPLWDNWIVFVLLAGVLSVEWWIRKRCGLP